MADFFESLIDVVGPANATWIFILIALFKSANTRPGKWLLKGLGDMFQEKVTNATEPLREDLSEQNSKIAALAIEIERAQLRVDNNERRIDTAAQKIGTQDRTLSGLLDDTSRSTR